MIDYLIKIQNFLLDAFDGDFYDVIKESNDNLIHCSNQTEWNSEDGRDL